MTTTQKLSDIVSSWNRPTLNYKLECDVDGPTRAEALETVTGSLLKSEDIDKIQKWGTWLMFCYLALIIIFLIANDKGVEPGAALIFFYVLMRLMYVIQAPAVGYAIFQSLNTSDENIGKVDGLVLVANCMDEQTYIDTDQFLKLLNDQRDTIVTCLRLWYTSLGFCGFEVLAVIGLLLS